MLECAPKQQLDAGGIWYFKQSDEDDVWEDVED
jgi:hypothetical protein